MDISIGDRVSVTVPLSYLKTADPMPMLRPPDLISADEVGKVLSLKGIDLVEVCFRNGKFLIPIDRLKKITQEQ